MEVTTDIALLYKGERMAVLALTATPKGGAIIKLDSDVEDPEVIVFKDYFPAIASFDRSLTESKKKGWKCFHRGAPNWG